MSFDFIPWLIRLFGFTLEDLSGTEVVEGGPVGYTNSEQTLFSQFHGNGLFLKGLVALISYPAPMQGKVKHELRDTDHYCAQ